MVEISTDDAWLRDIGPTFVVDGSGGRRGVDWRFNAWGGHGGGLYEPWDRDDRVAAKVLEIEGPIRYRAPIVLEGGSIHVDGEGTVLTTEECLLNRTATRSSGATRSRRRSTTTWGPRRWSGSATGVFKDETDGHVDNLACFARPGVVLLTWVEDPADPQHEISARRDWRASRRRPMPAGDPSR